MEIRVIELDPDDGQDDLDAYLASLTPEEREEVEEIIGRPERVTIIEHDD